MKTFINWVLLIIMLTVFFIPVTGFSEEKEWWNDKWQYRKKISFDTTPAGADVKENLSDFPLLIRLHSGNFNFANAKEDGSDIRFVTSDGKNLLKHHIERYDSIDEIALIWINAPRISALTAQEYLWLYYGNNDAMGGQDSKGSYDIDQIVVMHLSELEGLPVDSTAYGNNASEYKGSMGLPSIIGTGMTLSGADDGIIIQNTPSMDFSAGLTFSAWVKVSEQLPDAGLFTISDESGAGIQIGIEDSMLFCRVTSETGNTTVTEKTTGLAPMTWQHITVTIIPNGRISVFLDGIESTWVQIDKSMPLLKGDMIIGNSANRALPFIGDLDEINIAKTARSSSFIRLLHLSQAMDSQFNRFDEEEINEGGGLPVFYLATIVKNISLDGWIIIIILSLFAVLSWVVMLSKSLYLSLVEKDNKAFLKPFEENSNPLFIDKGEDLFEESPIFRMYRSGCENLRTLVSGRDNTEKFKLTQKTVNSVRTFLDGMYVREDQRLNQWLVLLTMAITGGPFLGLLGTVWGVMNTFAAMAEAGEANIMAIAPGVASALSTTVFGLIVAIPALFGYNYLASRIKKISADMDIFLDQFLLRLENTYGEDLHETSKN